MPEFNQAFIKAYQQRPKAAAGGTPAPHHEPPATALAGGRAPAATGGGAPPPHHEPATTDRASTASPQPLPRESGPPAAPQPIFRLEPATALPAPHLRFPVVDLPRKRRTADQGDQGQTNPARPEPEPPPVSRPAESVAAGSTAANSIREAPAAATAPPIEDPRPLSDFTGARPVREFRPALEVPYFLWPEVCRTIVAQRKDQLARLAASLQALGAGARVAVTSRERGEGRTTLVACLAAHLAQSGSACCLVDADFARPQLARRLGVQPQVGWEEVLSGEVPLSEALVESGRDCCALLPLANPQPDDLQLLGKVQAGVDLGVLGENYSLVLLDTGPWEGLAALSLQMLCSQGAIDALLIVADRRRPDQDLATLAGDLGATGVRLVGIVENFTAVSGAASG